MKNTSSISGFTLIELMIVIAIIGIIAAIAIPNLIEARKHGNEAAAIGALRTIVTAQSLFREGDKDNNSTYDYGSLEDLRESNLIDAVLGGGEKQGYDFNVDVSENGSQFFVTAAPTLPGESGDNTFYISDISSLRVAIWPDLANENSDPFEEKEEEENDQGVKGSMIADLAAMIPEDLLDSANAIKKDLMKQDFILSVIDLLDTNKDDQISSDEIAQIDVLILARQLADRIKRLHNDTMIGEDYFIEPFITKAEDTLLNQAKKSEEKKSNDKASKRKLGKKDKRKSKVSKEADSENFGFSAQERMNAASSAVERSVAD